MCTTGNAVFNDNAANRSDKSYFAVDSSVASTASSFVNALPEDISRARISTPVTGIARSDAQHIAMGFVLTVT
ncbi:hypothetical protein ACFLUZ_06100 [Chloroflexota bacterium]